MRPWSAWYQNQIVRIEGVHMTNPRDRALHLLLQSLTRELFQTETSASGHCRREAERLNHAAPAYALRAVAQHAQNVLRELPTIAERHGVPLSGGGVAVGQVFSELRDRLLDRLMRSERSYRGMLLGIHHGVDLVRLLERAASEAGQRGLAEFCQAWLQTRVPIVQRLEEQSTWFAVHPERAMKRSTVETHIQGSRPMMPATRKAQSN
jgi:hypothetical protein